MLLKDAFKIRIHRRSIDVWISAIVAVIFLAIALVTYATGYDLFRKSYFTSDGFHYYSALRNFGNHLSFWEGPTFEYILGNHSYVSMYLLAPLVPLFLSPYLMVFVNISSHFIAALLLVMCSHQILVSPFRRTFSWLLGILYITFPMVVEGFFAGVFMFQPDYLLAPMLALLFLFALKDKERSFLCVAALIILTKEEYIPLFPAFCLLILHSKYLSQGRCFPSVALNHTGWERFFVRLAVTYLLASSFSLFVLFYFRSLNDVNHAVRTAFNFGAFIQGDVWLSALRGTFDWAWPLLPILLLTLAVPKHWKIYFAVLYLVLFAVGRILLNVLVYGYPDGSLWSNVLIAPTFFIAIVTIVGVLSQKMTRRSFQIAGALAVTLGITCSVYQSFRNKTDSLTKIIRFLAGDLSHRYPLDEIQSIRSQVPMAKGMGFIVTEEYLMGSFMDRSHVSKTWLLGQPLESQDKIISQADFIFLFKSDEFALRLAADTQHISKVAETSSLVLFKKYQ